MRQAIIRMEESMYANLKSTAKRQGRSLNSLVVNILKENLEGSQPKLNLSDYAPSAELLSLGKTFSGLTEQAASFDSKTQYILSK